MVMVGLAAISVVAGAVHVIIAWRKEPDPNLKVFPGLSATVGLLACVGILGSILVAYSLPAARLLQALEQSSSSQVIVFRPKLPCFRGSVCNRKIHTMFNELSRIRNLDSV